MAAVEWAISRIDVVDFDYEQNITDWSSAKIIYIYFQTSPSSNDNKYYSSTSVRHQSVAASICVKLNMEIQ